MFEDQTLFESAFHHASIGMAIISLEGKWLKVNGSVCKMLGYSHEEFQGLTFQKLTHPDDLEADLSLVRMLLAGEIQTYQLEKRYFAKSGNIVWGLLSVSLIRDADQSPKFFISQIQDITELKLAEVELLKKARLETLLKVSVQLAHEINNPLTIIELNAHRIRDLLNEGKLQGGKPEHALRKLFSASQRINDIIATLNKLNPEEIEDRIDPTLLKALKRKT